MIARREQSSDWCAGDCAALALACCGAARWLLNGHAQVLWHTARVLLNLLPLRRYRDFRLLFVGQTVSLLGSMLTYVAVPYQVYQLTKSSWLVGMVSAAQLLPVLALGLLGGAFADRLDRRRLLVWSEVLLTLGAAGLAVNAARAAPSLQFIFAMAVCMQAVNAFHRPAMDALNQKLVEPADYGAIGALSSLRHSMAAILGPAIGGILIAWGGAQVAFWADAASFLVSVVMLVLMRPTPAATSAASGHWQMIVEGVNFARSRPELIGTYLVDMVAMTFAFPVALFPQMAVPWGGAHAAGMLFASMAIGSLVMSALSGWTVRVPRHGAAVVVAAGMWGVFVAAAGFANNLPLAVLLLALAGAADMMSGLFRSIIWNETVPNEMRGRLAGAEMISYLTGPLLGNARAGYVAAFTSVQFSLVSGGLLCVAGVLGCAVVLRQFWQYVGARADAGGGVVETSAADMG